MAKKNNNVFSSQYPSGIAFVGLIVLGVGVGMAAGHIAVGTLIGVGVGFLTVAVMSTRTSNKHLDR